MSLTVVTPARSRDLTTVARTQATLGVSQSTDPDVFASLVAAASAAVESYCHRPFAREAYSELLPGYGDIHLMLARSPIVAVSSVSVSGSLVTDYSVGDAIKGFLYRRAGWAWTAQTYSGLAGGGAWLDRGWPLPRQEEPSFAVAYTAGYLMPYTANTISAAAADNSISDSAGALPAGAVEGDVVTLAGFQAAKNNGVFTIGAAPTVSKWILSGGTLALEAAGNGVTVSGLPADLEKAAYEVTKSYYLGRAADSAVVEKAAGPMRLRYSEQGTNLGIPPIAIGLLRPWVRAA